MFCRFVFAILIYAVSKHQPTNRDTYIEVVNIEHLYIHLWLVLRVEIRLVHVYIISQ